jgi:outer membrane protease
MRKFSVLLVILSFVMCATAISAELSQEGVVVQTKEETTAPTTSSSPRFNIGAGYMYTWGSLNTTLNASEDFYPFFLKGDKISQLDYKTDAGMFIINSDAFLFWRLYLDAFVGIGDIQDGEQTDTDWMWQISDQKWLESKSAADGNVNTWNVNVNFRVIEEKDDKGYFDLCLGYLYYRDDITNITDLVYYIENWEPVYDPIAGHDSSDKYTFDGFRLGGRAKIRMSERFALVGNIGFMPWMDAERSGYWNLRYMDISGDTRGTAFDLMAGVEFKITKFLFVEVGYKYMSFDTNEGDYFHTIDGVKYEYRNGWGSTEATRSGVYAMGKLKF